MPVHLCNALPFAIERDYTLDGSPPHFHLAAPRQTRYDTGVIRRLGQTACLLAAFVVAGGHWAVLQSVAWVGMLANYSGQHGLVAGVSKTFDGQHPCGLCKTVEEGQKQEGEKLPLVKSDKKTDCLTPRPLASLPIRTWFTHAPPLWQADLRSALRDDEPTPPPRTLS
jgi:hypothetical protein